MIKLFNESSNNVNDLSTDFIPIANHLLSFIQYFVSNNPGYGYDIISTRRSWYSQKKITTIYDDSSNGLSWYLYGNAISINVYQKVTDQVLDNSNANDYTKNIINFQDGSALTFITACQEWFNNNLLNGNIVKIFGIYPTVKDNINVNINKLEKQYKNDPYVIYWGGLFNGNSNFTHWEGHPGYLPTDISIIRQNFLNTSYQQYDLISNFSNEVANTVPTYTPDELEIIEEDFLSIWKLKCQINHQQSYNLIDLFSWSTNNQYSMSQAIIIYQIKGDYNNVALFKQIQNNTINSSFILDSPLGYQYITYTNEFGEEIEVTTDTQYTLPTDNMQTSDTYDQIQLSLPDTNQSMYNNSLSSVSTSKIVDEITQTSNVIIDPRFMVNEHGMIGDLTINPNKLVTSLDDAIDLTIKSQIFEEMITPPEKVPNKPIKGIIDITSIIQNNPIYAKNSDEMIIPPK